jgi:hypothetical protein
MDAFTRFKLGNTCKYAPMNYEAGIRVTLSDSENYMTITGRNYESIMDFVSSNLDQIARGNYYMRLTGGKGMVIANLHQNGDAVDHPQDGDRECLNGGPGVATLADSHFIFPELADYPSTVWVEVLCPKCGNRIQTVNGVVTNKIDFPSLEHPCGFSGSFEWVNPYRRRIVIVGLESELRALAQSNARKQPQSSAPAEFLPAE